MGKRRKQKTRAAAPPVTRVVPTAPPMEAEEYDDCSAPCCANSGSDAPAVAVAASAPQPATVVTEATPLVGPGPVTTHTTTTYAAKHRPYGDVEDSVGCLLNVFWIFCGGGLVVGILYYVVGFVLCCTIVGAPCGFQLFKLGNLALWPFGQHLHGGAWGEGGENCGMPSCLGNVLFLPLGIVLVLVHLLCAIVNACSIVGIPFAVQHFKLANMALCPFGASADRDDHVTMTTTTMVETAYLPV